jgi:hypothetical protein
VTGLARGPLAAVVALLGATGIMAGALASEPIALSGIAVEFHTEIKGMDRLGPLVWPGGLELRSPDPRFGGISAIDVSPDGTQLLAITDRGQWIRARLGYDGDAGSPPSIKA